MNSYSLLMILLSLFVYKYIQQYKGFHIKGPLKKLYMIIIRRVWGIILSLSLLYIYTWKPYTIINDIELLKCEFEYFGFCIIGF